MNLTQQHTKVLVVGAGPSGLMMAAQLLRNGVQPIIIDSKDGPTSHSKALAVQARSLEIYRQMGLADRAVSNGKPTEGVIFYEDDKKVAQLSLKNVGEGQTPFPYVLMYQQSKNERLLLDYLTENCCPVYWNTSLVSLKQNAQQAEAVVKSGETTVTITTDWVVGADGAHSVVRKSLGIPFKGDTYAQEFYLIDAKLDNAELDNNFVQLFLAKQGFAGFFEMPEARNFRIIGNLPEGYRKEEELQLDDVLAQLDTVSNSTIKILKNHWFATYKLHHRMAEKFREQRCFLVGDAAHIHSPVGGQGMNTGLQDAYNLAWKMAGVVNGQLKPAILHTYADERMPIARRLLNTTDRVFKVVTSRRWYVSLFKKWLLPGLLKFVWGKPGLREDFFKTVSQIGISYSDSPLSLHISNAIRVKAGDRLPYLKVYDEKRDEETDLHTWCTKPGFTLILFGQMHETDLFAMAQWITRKYPNYLNFFYLPPSARNQPVFDAFEIKEHHKKAVIVRPDTHIGFISDIIDTNVMDNYLQNEVGLIRLS